MSPPDPFLRLVGALLALATVGSPMNALANPLDAFGFGARSTAMGGACAASVNDFSATYYNPAAVATQEQLRLDFGYTWMQPALRLSDEDLNVDASRGVQGGLLLAGSILGHRLGLGLGIHLPDNLMTRVRSLPQRQPRFALYDNRPQRMVITASLGFEVTDWLSIGVGLTFLSHSRINLEVQGDVGFSDVNETFLTSEVTLDLTSIRYASAGIRFQYEGFQVGVAFRDEFDLRLQVDALVAGDLVIEGDPIVEDASYQLISDNHNLFSPRQLVLGLAYSGARFLVEADLGWIQWSRFPSPTAVIQATVDIPGFDFPLPDSDAPSQPGFTDIFVPRIGIEGIPFKSTHAELVVRGGYFFEQTPAPDQPGDTNFVDMDKHGVSVGLGLSLFNLTEVLPKPLRLDATALLIYLPRRNYAKASAADPVGDYHASGMIYGGSMTVSLEF